MTKVLLKEHRCPHCEGLIKNDYVDIRYFRSNAFRSLSERVLKTIMLPRGDKCWRCKVKPQVGETWGLSISYKERNRLWCPECSEWLETQMKIESKKNE